MGRPRPDRPVGGRRAATSGSRSPRPSASWTPGSSSRRGLGTCAWSETRSATPWRGGTPAAARECSPARTSTRCWTGVRTTDRSASSRRWPRWTRCASARRGADAADRRRDVRGGGGVAVRHRLPGLAARDRGDELGAGARAARPRRGGLRRRRGGRVVELAGRRGDVRRAARGAGPRPRRPRCGRGGGQRDLAARPVSTGLHRRGQPRRHHPDGGPGRPDADLRDDRARRQQAGPAGRAAGHVRPGGGDPQRDQRGALAGDRVAGRALRE